MAYEYEKLIVEKNGAIAKVTFNDPKVLNAMSTKMTQELGEVVAELEADNEVRVVIFTGGEGKAFVAGADVAYMANANPDFAREYSKGITVATEKMRMGRKVYIAAINGFTFGGGLEFALACDLRIASEKAVFGFPEVGLGILPGAGGTQRLPRLIGVEKAKEIILTGDNVFAAQALEYGFVGKVVAPEALQEEAVKLAERILKNSPLAVAYAKESIQMSEVLPLPEEEELRSSG